MSKQVTNYMGGSSFQPTPVERLKLLLSSGIFGEPKYYIGTSAGDIKKTSRGKKTKPSRPPTCTREVPKWLRPFLIINTDGSVEDIMEKAIDEALDADFETTVSLLPVLRHKFLMRKNPQILAVRACLHPKRVEYTSKKGLKFSDLLLETISRPDDISTQLQYLISVRSRYSENLPKKVAPVVPGILKRTWSKKIEGLDRYRMMKYGTLLIDPIRLSHAKGPLVGELLKEGKIKADDIETTWERLRSDGKSWGEIVSILSEGDKRFPHMALLRNLRSLYEDSTVSNDQLGNLLEQLVNGVSSGKQFPFRYYSAYKEIAKEPKEKSEWDSDSDDDKKHESVDLRRECVTDALLACVTKSLQNVPKLKGHTVTLCDNSGSAWGAGPSEYSKVRVAEIANLGGLMAASVSDSSTVVTFGDKYKEYKCTPNILGDLSKMCKDAKDHTNGVGQSTEAGIWLYLDKAIKKKIHIDNLFIYSDMQAGTGGLYGTNVDVQYRVDPNDRHTQYINIPKMIDMYRKTVNPKMNVFSIQVAGYDNSVLPMYIYRGAILSGWTGAEIPFASELISLWNNHDQKKSQ